MTTEQVDRTNERPKAALRLVRHQHFTLGLAAEIRKPGGVERAMRALYREFFPYSPFPGPSMPVTGMWRRVNNDTIEVNLDHPPKLPFPGATPEWKPAGKLGWVTIERRGHVNLGNEAVYQDNREMVLHIEGGQKKYGLPGTEMRALLQDAPNIHPNVMDSMCEAGMIPGRWWPAQGNVRIFSWAVGFRGPGPMVFVRYWGHGYTRTWCEPVSESLRWYTSEPAARLANIP